MLVVIGRTISRGVWAVARLTALRNPKESCDVDFGNQITMEKAKLPIHKHPLLPITRFFSRRGCNGCGSYGYIYGGYRCNELGCETPAFHRECAESLQEIKHFSHPDHPLNLRLNDKASTCNRCGSYICLKKAISIYVQCVTSSWIYTVRKEADPLPILENSNVHEHPLELFDVWNSSKRVRQRKCKTCDSPLFYGKLCYVCYQWISASSCSKTHPFHLQCLWDARWTKSLFLSSM